MAEQKKVLAVTTTRVVTREELAYAIPEQVKAAPENAAISFLIKPLKVEGEEGVVLDKLAGVAEMKQCNGNVWTPAMESKLEALETK
jgi:hypothetical protein